MSGWLPRQIIALAGRALGDRGRLWMPLRRVWEILKEFFEALYVVRACVLAAIFGFAALSLPDQTREIYRILALDLDEPNGGWRVLAAFMALVLASLTFWYIGRRVTKLHDEAGPARSTIAAETLRWVPRIVGATLPAGVALGLVLGSQLTVSEMMQYSQPNLDFWMLAGSVVCMLIGGGVILFTIYRHRLPWPRSKAQDDLDASEPIAADHPARTRAAGFGRSDQRRGLFSWHVDLLLCVIALSFVPIICFWPVALPQLVGTLPPFFLFILVTVVGLSALFAFSDRLRIPFTAILAALAVLFSWRDWGNHHGLTMVAHRGELPSVERAFASWLAARIDKGDYKGDTPYPVFIVAAPGGGLYSAQFAATVLARLQDLCPRFAHHMFAISGVSGGALGAAVFSSLARRVTREHVDNSRCDLIGPVPPSYSAGATLEAGVAEFMARDFMAPVATTALFLDLPQRLIPYPVLPFDRAGALERAFSLAWGDVADRAERMQRRSDNFFEAPFLSHWDPRGSAPALLLNATEVSKGHRVVIAPFVFDRARSDTMLLRRMLSFHADLKVADSVASPGAPGHDVSLATAVGLSARFPWVMPAAPLGRLRLVDGAVFENSGIETAMDLITELRHYDDDLGPHLRARPTGAPRVRFTLIALHNFDDYSPRGDRTPSGLMAPIQALLSARAARSSFALSRADDSLCGQRGDSCIHTSLQYRDRELRPLVPIYLDHVDNALALGWHLSRDTRRVIENQASLPGQCRIVTPEQGTAPQPDSPMAQRVPIHNACSACLILARLSADPQAAANRCGRSEDGRERSQGSVTARQRSTTGQARAGGLAP